jgi:hypothetical protein
LQSAENRSAATRSLCDGSVWSAKLGSADPAAEGFASLSAKFAGDFRRSACVLVALEGGAGERNVEEGSAPVDARRLREHLGALADAGADEAILVLDPINERSVAAVAHLLYRRDVPVAKLLNRARSPLACALNAHI